MSLFLDAMRKSSREPKQRSDQGDNGESFIESDNQSERQPEHQYDGRHYRGQIVDVDDVLGVGLVPSENPLTQPLLGVEPEPGLPEPAILGSYGEFGDETPIEFSHQSDEIQLASDPYYQPVRQEVYGEHAHATDEHTQSTNSPQAGDLSNHEKTPQPQRPRPVDPMTVHGHDNEVSAEPGNRWFRFNGLDSLFYVIIAVASLLMFASVFVLLTRNNAYIEREYEFLRKQSEGLEARLAAATVQASGEVDGLAVGGTQAEGVLAQSNAINVTAIDPLSNRASQKSAAPEAALKADSTTTENSQSVEQAASDSIAVKLEPVPLDTASTTAGPQLGQVDEVQVVESSQVTVSGQVPGAGNGNASVDAVSSSALENSRVVMGYQSEIYELRNEVIGLKNQLLIQSSKIERLLGENQRLSKEPAPTLSFGFTTQSSGQSWSALTSGTSDKSIPVVTPAESAEGEVTLTVATLPYQGNLIAPTPAVEDESTDIEDLIGRAYEAYRLANYSKAASLYNRALQFDPYHRDANLGVAASAQVIGDYATAEIRYRHLLSLDARDVTTFTALLNLNGTVADSGIESELIVHVERTADPQPLYAALGSYYSQKNRWDDAKWAYLNAVNANPPDADYLFNLAVVLDNLGDVEGAQDYYAKALMGVESNGRYTFDATAARVRLNTLSSR